MRKILAFFLIAAGTMCLFGAPVSANHDPGKVTICHRTNSDNNPYVVISPDSAAVDGAAPANGDHYLEHVGPVWDNALKDLKIEWGDIIPPVPGHHNGLNWTAAGQAIYNNGCAPAVPPTTTTTVAPTTTTTVAPTTTTVPEEPTTTTVPDKPVTQPRPPITPDEPELIPPVVIERPVAQPVQELPRTGSGTSALMALGVGLILSGVALTHKSKRSLG